MGSQCLELARGVVGVDVMGGVGLAQTRADQGRDGLDDPVE